MQESDNPRIESAVQGFEPARYMRKVNGGDYLEVKWRLVWLRDRHPDAETETVMVSHDPERQAAVFKAVVRLPSGGLATGYGSETGADFSDYIEKAETKALGRALSALGFGAQFAPDHDFGVDQGRIVDAPVRRPGATQDAGRAQGGGNYQQAQQQRSAAPQGGQQGHQGGGEQMATPGQVKFLYDLFLQKLQYDEHGMASRLLQEYEVQSPEELTKREAMELIPVLKQEAGLPID